MCLKDHPNMPFEFTLMEAEDHEEEEWKQYADLQLGQRRQIFAMPEQK